jgi:glycosyltransferase involved in cell wall biosynthesis
MVVQKIIKKVVLFCLVLLQEKILINYIYSYANLFVLPSYNEGLSLDLLEVMSYRLPVVASDIPANLAVGLPSRCYFPGN